MQFSVFLILYRQSLLALVKDHMEWCLAKCHHNDQSLNLGKCLIYATEMGCQEQGGVCNCFISLCYNESGWLMGTVYVCVHNRTL